jgi:hypothetical protein
MLTIRKKSNKNFWHYDSNFTNAYSASDLTIIFDGNTVKLRSENGRVVFDKDGYRFSSITIYDDSTGGGAEVFASSILLAERLVALGYNGYYEDGEVVVAGVSSAFGRTGAVVAVTGDYEASEVTNAVTDNTAQDITEIKTFTVSPIVPTPTTDFQASTKKYVDDNSGSGLPAGGTAKQLLIKQSATNGDFAFGFAAALNTTLDPSSLVVAPASELQEFAEEVDGALLRARGTGVVTTYVSTVSVGGTTFAQPVVSGEINSDEGYFSVSYAGATGITVTTLSSPSTYVYIDNAGNLQQQTSIPTRQDWSRKMFTMRIAVDTVANTIIGFEYLNNPIGHYANSIRDLYTALIAQGVPFKGGQTITGRAADLGFDVSAGTIMEFGGTGDINNANVLSLDAVANATYDLLSRTAIATENETNLVKFWDNNTVITALGSTTVVGHRLYRFSNGQFAMQYGQENYANITLAKAGVLLEDYDLNPRLLNATFFGWWLIQETATNTGGTTLTDFREYTIGVQGGSSSGLAGCLLRGNNLSDLLDVPAARTNLGLDDIVDFISGLIPLPVDSSYKLIVKAPYAGTITEVTTISASGTCTATFKINTTALGGTANSVSSTEESQAHASANAFVAGDDIVLTVSANATCVDMSFTIKFTKTLV